MDKYFKSHRIFSMFFTGWIILQIIILIYIGLPYDDDNLVFPFATLSLKYYGIWEQVIYSILIYGIYNAWTTRNRKDGEDEIFSEANVEFLSDQNLNTRINEIIKEADKFLMLVTPFIRLSPPLRKELKLLQGTNVELYVIFGKNEGNISKSLPFEDLEVFKDFKNVRIAYTDTLHAKFYANQDYMILTSMNLLEYSQVMNSECGIRIKPTSYMTDSDNTIWNDTLKYFKDLYDVSKVVYKKTGSEFEDNIHSYYVNPGKSLEQKKSLISNGEASYEPKNVGNAWTAQEEAKLLQLYRTGKPVDEIAQTLERKVGGIKARLVKLGEIEE